MASINLIKASDGTGNASTATVQTVRNSGVTTIIVDTVNNISATFMGSMGTPHTFVDPVTAEEITVISEATAVDFTGHVSGANLEIDSIAPGYTDLGSAVGDIIVIRPTTDWGNNIATVLEVAHEDTGALKDSIVVAAKIAANAVETAKIKDANITTAKIADANVTTAKIADLNVTTGKIANSAVTGAKRTSSGYHSNPDTASQGLTIEDTVWASDNTLTTTGGKVVAFFSASGISLSAGTGVFWINYPGGKIKLGQITPDGTDKGSFSGMAVIPGLAAGSHYFKVTGANSGGTMYMTDYNSTSFVLFEIGA